MTDPDSLTVEELIASSAELDDRVDGLFGRLSQVCGRATSRDHGIDVTVNLEGMLIGLELTHRTLDLGPRQLSAEIFRLTQDASASALAQGMAILAPVAGEELTAELAEVVGVAATVPKLAGPAVADEDFSKVESWTLP